LSWLVTAHDEEEFAYSITPGVALTIEMVGVVPPELESGEVAPTLFTPEEPPIGS
jgi:hypothetical protein